MMPLASANKFRMAYKHVATVFRDVLLNTLAASPLWPGPARRYIYRMLGLRIGRTSISAWCFFGGTNFHIGDNSFINYKCFFDGTGPVTIGRDCLIGMQATFITSSHEHGDSNRRGGALTGKPIEVGDGCWIGARATIMPGVRIGKGTIIAAGSLVANDCDESSLYRGIPAKKVRDLD